RPETLLESDRCGAVHRRGAEHVHRRHAARRDVPDLPLRAESLKLAVTADADLAAGRIDLRRLVREHRERPRRGRPPAGPAERLLLDLVGRRKALELRVVPHVAVLVPVVLTP